MRRSLARYSAPVSSVHAPSWADFITTMVGFRVFGTHTGAMRAEEQELPAASITAARYSALQRRCDRSGDDGSLRCDQPTHLRPAASGVLEALDDALNW